MTARRSGKWSTELPDWRCYLCGRSAQAIGDHPLPIRQKAHLLPNRLTGAIQRYNGVKNALVEAEWESLLQEIGPALREDLSAGDRVRDVATEHCYELCGECHEEVLSEPVYLPSVMAVLRKHFEGASRVKKISVLTRILALGAESLERQERGGA